MSRVTIASFRTIVRMPVSRGRKNKKKSGKGSRGRSPVGLQSVLGSRERPRWFDPSIKTVLDQADVLVPCGGPRELEQTTAELLGAELYRVVYEERGGGLWFDWWFQELAEAAASRVREGRASDSAWEGPWRLLHGLTSIGSPALLTRVQAALSHARKVLWHAPGAQAPGWLRGLYKIAATGEVWEMRDAYGSRMAIIAELSYPDHTDPSVFLFDIDACGSIELAGAGVFDDVDQAAGAWRTYAGDTANDMLPRLVESPDRLYCLAHWSSRPEMVTGDETRVVMDNLFRARRRADDLADALRKRGMPLPRARPLFRDINTAPMAESFTRWYVSRHSVEPDSDAVDALAEVWLEGCLPGTEHAASPHRARCQARLISDWQSDHPVTVGAKALLPEWVRWHGEEARLPEHLIDRAVAAATAGPETSVSCGNRVRQL
jgi:hypothetical protein